MLAHLEVSDAPEDESKPTVKQGRHKGQQVAEEGDDFGNNKGRDPSHAYNGNPGSPANNSVGVDVSGALEDVEEDELGRDGRVQDAKEHNRGDGKGEGNLHVLFL